MILEMDEMMIEALNRFVVAAAPNDLNRIDFDWGDDSVAVIADGEYENRLKIFLNGSTHAHATIDIAVKYYNPDYEVVGGDDANAKSDEKGPAVPSGDEGANVNADTNTNNVKNPVASDTADGPPGIKKLDEETSGGPAKRRRTLGTDDKATKN